MAFDINDTSPRDQYTASGGQTLFTISFEFLEDADIKAYLTPNGSDPDDAVDLLTLTTDYTLIGAGANGVKTLTLVNPATADDVITIMRDAGVDRDTEFLSNGDLTIAAMNQELDKIITLIQQTEMNQEQRSLMFQRAAQIAGVSLAIPAPVANAIIGVWNATADEIEIGPTATDIADAEQNAIDAAAAYAATLALWDQFNNLYLGSKASAPALDNDGNALTAGDMYFNSTTDDLWFYTGAAWQLYNSSAASSANTVSIADVGTYYTGTDVEAALQEIGLEFEDGDTPHVLDAEAIGGAPSMTLRLKNNNQGREFFHRTPKGFFSATYWTATVVAAASSAGNHRMDVLCYNVQSGGGGALTLVAGAETLLANTPWIPDVGDPDLYPVAVVGPITDTTTDLTDLIRRIDVAPVMQQVMTDIDTTAVIAAANGQATTTVQAHTWQGSSKIICDASISNAYECNVTFFYNSGGVIYQSDIRVDDTSAAAITPPTLTNNGEYAFGVRDCSGIGGSTVTIAYRISRQED